MTLNKKLRKLCVHYKRHDGTPILSVFDNEQVATMLGIFEQSRNCRVECARQIGNCLDELKKRHSGFAWYSKPVNVVVRTKKGIVVESRHPLPARVCEFVFFVCLAKNQASFRILKQDLWSFMNGSDTWMVRANTLFDQDSIVL